jgi:hypothetical protein
MTTDGPTVTNVKRHAGIAGQYSISAEVQYPNETPQSVSFVGSTYGGPIVMVRPNGRQVFIDRAVTDRIGEKLTPEWVARFFGGAE